MTIEANLHRNCLIRKESPLSNSRWEIPFALAENLGKIILNETEADLVIDQLKFLVNKENIKSIWHSMQRSWYKLCIDTTRSWSHYDDINKEIILWIEWLADIDKRKILSLDGNLSDNLLLWEILHHEMCHYILNKLTQDENKYTILVRIQNILQHQNGYVSKLAHGYSYPNSLKEDMTELIRLYRLSPNSLKVYLNGLSSTVSERIIQKYHLCKLNSTDANTLYELMIQLLQ